MKHNNRKYGLSLLSIIFIIYNGKIKVVLPYHSRSAISSFSLDTDNVLFATTEVILIFYYYSEYY
jgi:hypothetical protein